MLINARFKGLVEEVIEYMLRRGIAMSKAEAIRIMALEYARQYPEAFEEEDKKFREEIGSLKVAHAEQKLNETYDRLLKEGTVSEADFIRKKR